MFQHGSPLSGPEAHNAMLAALENLEMLPAVESEIGELETYQSASQT